MPTGLIRRAGRYSTRRVIPLELQPHYGRREIVRALGTADPQEARKLHARLWVQLDREFEAALTELKSRKPEVLPQPQPREPDRYARMSREEFDHEAGLRDYDPPRFVLEDYEQEELADLQARIEARLADPKATLTDEERAIRLLLKHRDWKADVAEEHASVLRVQARETKEKAPQPAKGAANGTPLSAVVEKWAAENKPIERTVRRTRNIVDRFEAVNGKLNVEAVTKQHVIAFKDRLVADGQSPANINVMLPMLGTVFNYAIHKLHLIEINPASKVRVADKRRAKDKRRAFNEDELAAIFGSPVYAHDARPVAGAGEAAYWLPLLALYTGARLNELGQLHPEDVVQESYRNADDKEQKAWVIRIDVTP